MTNVTGAALNQRVHALPVPYGTLALCALGQSGLIVKGGETIIYIDPYLSNYVEEGGFAPPGTFAREFPPPLSPHEATHVHAVFCTHEHADHTDPLTVGPLAAAAPEAVFIGPANSREVLLSSGIAAERIHVPPTDEPQSLGALTFTAVPAAHYDLEHDPQRGYRWWGFIIEVNGVTLYHSGDTILYPGLVERLQRRAIDIACLPVNGRDGWRERLGLTGNLDGPEAAQLAARIGADVLIPMHNDLFASNHVSPAVLAEFLDRRYPRQKYHWLQPGELYVYVRG
jgi:L-ascorbate metabolism protein UlaG (beta-lactamase superfamily)